MRVQNYLLPENPRFIIIARDKKSPRFAAEGNEIDRVQVIFRFSAGQMMGGDVRAICLKRTILVLALLGVGCAWPSDADIQSIVDQISQTQYTVYQQAIENMGLGLYGGALYKQTARGRAFTGVLGDKGNQEARKYLVDSFAGFGLQAAVQGRFFNVVAEQTGALNPENVFIIAAHYDTLKSTFPGGDGDASGVAGVLEAARVLSQFKFDNTIRYVVFNATGKTGRGSYDYVKNIVGIGREQLLGVVYLDGILHPYHDKNPDLPEALSVGVGEKTGTAGDWAASFASAAQQFVPALALDANGPVIDVANDQFSFVTFNYLASLRLSENSSKDVANASLNTAADASDAAAGAHYDYAFAANVVRAAVGCIGRPAGYQAPADGSGSSFLDSDGDGYSDEIETVLLSDPALASSTPLSLPPATPAGLLETTNAVVSLDFSIASSDIVTVIGMLPIQAGFVATGSQVIVDVAGVVKSFALTAKGNGKIGANTFAVKIKSTRGIVAAQMAQFTFTLSKGNFKQQFGPLGLVNAGFAGKPVTIPLTVIFANEVRNTRRILIYASTKNMGGIAH